MKRIESQPSNGPIYSFDPLTGSGSCAHPYQTDCPVHTDANERSGFSSMSQAMLLLSFRNSAWAALSDNQTMTHTSGPNGRERGGASGARLMDESSVYFKGARNHDHKNHLRQSGMSDLPR